MSTWPTRPLQTGMVLLNSQRNRSVVKMRWIGSIICTALLAFSVSVSAGAIGMVLKAKGSVEIHRGSETLRAKKKFKVEAGDRIVTGKKDQVFLRMIDKSKMIIRPNSEVVLRIWSTKRNRLTSRKLLF